MVVEKLRVLRKMPPYHIANVHDKGLFRIRAVYSVLSNLEVFFHL
jgi:hypothetical protein